MKNKKIIINIILSISLFLGLALSFAIDSALYRCSEEYSETNESTIISNIGDNIEIKYNWQIAIPKLDIIAPIGEGTDIVTLRNRVGHIEGTGELSRKYMFSTVIIIQEIILLDITTLIELMN